MGRLTPLERSRLAAASYAEVLDATKHQDDKIGRFLSAIAFLFTGAVAFGVRGSLFRTTVSIDGHARSIAALFLGLFLVLSLLSVLLLVIALGPNLSLPREQRPFGHSWFFFLAIAGQTDESWKTHWEGVITDDRVASGYISEAHNLALKTEFKYARTNEARAVFTLGLMFLALSLSFTFQSNIEGNRDIAWTVETASWTAAIVAAFAGLLAYDYLRLDQDLDAMVTGGERLSQVWPLTWMVFAAPTFIWLILVGTLKLSHALVLSGLVACLVAVLAGVWLRWQGRRGARWPCLATACIGVLGVLAFAATLSEEQGLQLSLAIIVVVLLELPRVSIASRTLRRRMRHLRKTGAVPSLRDEIQAWARGWKGNREDT